jgi:two-component system, response regulator
MTSLRVLIVEDNPDHRFLTLRAIQRVAGTTIEVVEAADGAEALDCMYGRGAFAGQPTPQLVFLDLRMPRVDGLEVLQHVKADPVLHTIPVVVLTASDRPEDVEAAYGRGTNSYVTKPDSLAALEDVAEYWTVLAALPEPPAA